MDYGALIQLAMSLYGEQAAKNMTDAQLRMLGEQLANIQGIALPDLPQVQAEQLGDSAVAGLQTDPEMRSRQLSALDEVQRLVDGGGLDLQSKASLEEALGAAMNQQHRARAGVAADAAARGQLNSGNRLLMDMDAAQSGANNARAAGTQAAADASARRLQAIHDASAMSSNLREMDWREKESSARAKDLRDERNAQAREKATYYNAGLPQQNFTNAMAKATGQMPAANAYGGALGAAGADARNAAAGYGQAAYEAFRGLNAGGGQPTTYEFDSNTLARRHGPQDISEGDEK